MNAATDLSKGGIIEITDREFSLISELVYKHFGIHLTEKKKALVRGRLHKLIRLRGFTSFEDYYQAVINDASKCSLLSLVDRISTNHSYFFREAAHFDLLTSRVLPELRTRIDRKAARARPGKDGRSIRLWCAGCAAGEEPYSLAMVLREHLGLSLSQYHLGILATDIAPSVLEEAREGIYAADRLKHVPRRLKGKYFKQCEPNQYAVVDQIKRMVLFRRLNLMREIFPFKGKFHVIFCRNVMIYFDRQTRRSLIEKLHRFMHEDAYLFIGHSETLGREGGLFKYIQPSVYKRC